MDKLQLSVSIRRRLLAPAVALCAAAVLTSCGTSAAPGSPTPGADAAPGSTASVPGLVVFESTHDLAETVRRVRDGVTAAGGTVAGTVDHAVNAAAVGATIAPATVVFGGVPKAGTPLIAARQPAGLNLPQKFLVWEDPAGAVRVGYNDGGYLAATAGAEPAAAMMLSEGSARLVAAATGRERPSSGDPSSGDPSSGSGTGPGGYLITRTSDADPATTLRRLQDAVTAKGLKPAAVVDHAAAAAGIGITLRPTTVLLVGNPAAGTPLIARRTTMGIDLPLRFLVWQNTDGSTMVSYPDAARLAMRHGLPGDDPAVRTVATGAASFAAAATGGAG